MRRAVRYASASLPAFAGVLILAGCGSSITKHDYVLRAEGVCNATLRSLRLLGQPTLSGSTAARTASLAGYLDHAAPLVQTELRKLKGLPRPEQTPAQSRTLQRYLAALADTVEELQAVASAARSGNSQMVSAGQKSLATNSTSALAAAYGLRACSNPGAGYS
jgi:hypothetical protein